MALKPRKPLPNVGELVVGTIEEVHDFGAYLTLDDYGGIRAFLPWSEIASRMVRNIHAVLKPEQKVVVKVIRVYRNRGQVDVSLKRVSDGEKRRKMMWYKRTLKAATLIEMTAKKLGKSIDDAYRDVIWKLEDAYGDAMTGLEQAVIYGEKALREARIPEEWIHPVLEVARRHVEVRSVRISGILTLRTIAPDGVERIRKILVQAKEAGSSASDRVSIRIYTVGAPRYRIDVQGHDYRDLEEALSKVVDRANSLARELDVESSFERLKT
ncbi:MAG: translation initiation factor IF-2 subunit alpha [Desulfurococcales archaeon]|nr:translation initiation factor IF-2 subunit alpha [Desulfurococcales archaeon]MCE4605611.1 translation initiation factor IF-2 subunit alpha [Desulfurococcales archaeon]